LSEIDFNSLLPFEDENTVVARMLSDLPVPPGGESYNTREGSVIHGLFRPIVLERARLLSYAEELFRQSFIAYANGDYLDARAGELGVSRGTALNSVVTITVTGDPGTVINANNAVFASAGDSATGVESVSFIPNEQVTIPSGGSVSVSCTSTTAGTNTNVDAGQVSLVVESPDGVDSVNNAGAASGGADEEDDQSLRLSLAQRLQALAGTGNSAYYRSVALREPDVQNVNVDDLWDGAGTALVTLSGRLAPFVSPESVARLQNLFDPSVKNIAHFEGNETWTGGSVYTEALEGEGSRQMSASHSGGDTNMSIALEAALDLSEFNSADNEVSVFIKRVSGSARLRNFTIRFLSSNGGTATAVVSNTTVNALSGIADRATLPVLISSFTLAGSFNWASVTGVEFILQAPSSSGDDNVLVVDGLRVKSVSGGFLSGQVPIGIQVTVRSARASTVDIDADILLDSGLVVEDVAGIIESSINDYFRRLPPGSVVRVSEIANIIHDTRGVLDYENITFNALAANTNIENLGSDQGPILGSLTFQAI